MCAHLEHSILDVDCKQVKPNEYNRNVPLTNANVKNAEAHSAYIDELNRHIASVDRSFLKLTKDKHGITLSPSGRFWDSFQKNLNSIRNKTFSAISTESVHAETAQQVSSNATYFVSNEYANLGWSLASSDLNRDGSDDLLIGSPVYSELNAYQNGAVFIVLAKNEDGIPMDNLNLETSADFVIKPPVDVFNSRFGHSIAVLDLNLDGHNDIVIGAPSYDLANLNYQVRQQSNKFTK